MPLAEEISGNDTAQPLLSPSGEPLFKKLLPEEVPVTPASVALFRFGEQCNNDCPMCSNTGDPALFFHATEELLRRADFLHQLGFRRVVVTGGEPTIHPGFWPVVERLVALGFLWDINTHGRSFSKPSFARRAADQGLRRAIVSLHSHHPGTSAAIFGAGEAAHYETIEGVSRLVDAGIEVMLNCVLSRLNLDHLEGYLEACRQRFGSRVTFKLAFPTTIGKGGVWHAIASLRYAEVRGAVERTMAAARRWGLSLCFESVPNCVLGDPEATNLSRSGFGETHYLDDARGDRVYAMPHIEAELSAFGAACRGCRALAHCGGVSLAYAQKFGTDELTPFGA